LIVSSFAESNNLVQMKQELLSLSANSSRCREISVRIFLINKKLDEKVV